MALPKQIARFDVIGWLGSGSFATVWLANDKNLDSRVAIKVLAENWSFNPDATRRFIQEARDLRRLDDERIIRVYEAGELEDGRPYMVMDYADGGSLHQKMAKRASAGEPFTIDEAVGISLEIADCLISAHSHRIVHRDLKPSNVLFKSLGTEKVEALRREGRDAKSERIVLGDFGIARRLEGTMTYTQVVGTPHYMAPEQADPETAKDADYRCDIYAAAVILYELLAGRVPFPYDSLARVQKAQREEDPSPISELRPAVSAELAEVVARGLSRDVEKRIASAAEWRRELQGVVKHAGGEAPALAAAARPAMPAPPVVAPVAVPPVVAPVEVSPAAEPPPLITIPSTAPQTPIAPVFPEHMAAAGASATPVQPWAMRSPPAQRNASKLSRRNRVLVAAGVVVLVALAGTLIVLNGQRAPTAGSYVFPTVHDANFAVDRVWTLNENGTTLTGVATVANSSSLPADYNLTEVIPKSLARSVTDIQFVDQSPLVVQADPIVRFTFHLLGYGKSSVTYKITVPAQGSSRDRLVAWAQQQAVASADYAAVALLPSPTPKPSPTPTHKPAPKPSPTYHPLPTPTRKPPPINHPPKAVAETFTLNNSACDSNYALYVLNPGAGIAPDSDPDGNALTVIRFTAPGGNPAGVSPGTITLNATHKSLNYYFPCPAKGTGYWTFTYTISDGHGGTASTTDYLLL